MQNNQCTQGFDNPSKFREEWDKQTKRDILAHNKSVLANCQKVTRASQ